MELKKTLTDIGFDSKSADTYLALLSIGVSAAAEIAQKSGLNRVTTYGVLKKLIKEGVVEKVITPSALHFKAVPPARVFGQKQEQLEKAQKYLPEFSRLHYTDSQKPLVRFFEGMEAVKKAYKITLESKTEICNYANSQNIRDHWPEYDSEYVAVRARKNVFLRGIAPADAMGASVIADNQMFFREIRLVSQDLFPIEKVENEICLFDGKMLLVSFEPFPIAILIDSPSVYSTQLQIFEILWNSLQG